MRDNKKQILVVDDEEEVLDFLAHTLERAGYEVVKATTAKRAVKYAQCLEFDLIILDVMLPDASGTDIASNLSKDSQTKDIPILFLTGIITPQGEDFLTKREHKHDMLAKPVTASKLLSVVEKMVS